MSIFRHGLISQGMLHRICCRVFSALFIRFLWVPEAQSIPPSRDIISRITRAMSYIDMIPRMTFNARVAVFLLLLLGSTPPKNQAGSLDNSVDAQEKLLPPGVFRAICCAMLILIQRNRFCTPHHMCATPTAVWEIIRHYSIT